MILRSFLFSFKASCKLLISACYFAYVDSFSAENMITNLLSSPISIQNVSFKSVVPVYHCALLVHLSLGSAHSLLKKLQVSHFKMLFFSCRQFANENMIPEFLSSPISIQKVSFRSVIPICHCAQVVHLTTENIILRSKTSP